MRMEIKERLAKKALLCEEIINKYLPETTGYYASVTDAMRYSVSAGGKRVRPVIMMETCEIFGGAPSEILEPFVAAIEMIHTYSLIHDDLPAMDNDDYRRGRKTTHKVYGEAVAILAGDGLLNLAYEVAASAFDAKEYTDRVVRAIRVLATKPGYSGMIGGQTIDIEAERGNVEITEDSLKTMYMLKTSALMECSMMIGAILAGSNEKTVSEIEKIAGLMGLAFQIRDDILDIEGDEKKLGKPVGSDEKQGKQTVASIIGIDEAKKKVEELTSEAIGKLKIFMASNPSYDGFLSDLFDYMTRREN